MFRKIRRVLATTLRTASTVLPETQWLPVRMTRWVWSNSADLLDPEPLEEETRPVYQEEPSAPRHSALPAIDAQALRAMLEDPIKPLLLDIREPEETAMGIIPGALQIPMNTVQKRLGELQEDNTRPVVVYCARGQRSTGIASYLSQEGFYAVSLQGGLLAWEASGGQIQITKTFSA